MQALPPGGAMVAVQAGEDQVRAVLDRVPGVAVAAVNGPAAVVISGAERAVVHAAGELAASGVRTRRLRVSHAFHSPLMDPMLAGFAAVTASVAYAEPRVPLVSALTGALASGEVTDPGYWVRHVREPVRFADAVAALRAAGVRTFVEMGPDPVLSVLAGEEAGEVWLPVLRRGRDEPRTVVAAVAGAYVRGVPVDWAGFYAGSGVRRVDLPTYAFRHQRFWLSGGSGPVDAAGLGQAAAGHPLLGAAVDLPASGGLVLTGRLSLAALSWLGDHVVAGRVLLPGTAVAEMVVRAADEAGCGRVEELVIEVPLVVPGRGGVQVRVTVAEPDGGGRREVAVYARAEEAGPEGPWTRHAAGVLAAGDAVGGDAAAAGGAVAGGAAAGGAAVGGAVAGGAAGDAGLAQWPPAGAVPADLAGFYPALAEAGLAYGPVFRGVRRAWRRGEEVFAEVALPEGTPVAGFGVHPALLDAALHVIGLGDGHSAADGPVLPFAWADVVVHAAGASAARVRIVPDGPGVSVTLADADGALVASIRSLVLRPLPEAVPAGGLSVAREALFRLDWVPATPAAPAPDAVRWAVLGSDAGMRIPQAVRHEDLAALAAAGGPVPDVVVACCLPDGAAGDVAGAARAGAVEALSLVQGFLAEPALAGSRLVVVTRRAVEAGSGVGVEVAGAPVWGLVRAAAAEHPGRFVLADADEVAGAGELIVAGVSLGEPELAIRGGQLRIPRLARAGAGSAGPLPALGPDGTVLVTGASGGLGQLVARHLVTAWGVRHLVLLSRHGIRRPGYGCADRGAGRPGGQCPGGGVRCRGRRRAGRRDRGDPGVGSAARCGTRGRGAG